MSTRWGRKKKKEGDLGRAIELFEEGLSIRSVSRKMAAEGYGVDYNVVSAARALADLPEFCKCGDPFGHKGWCRVRVAQSPKRQALLDRLHKAQKGKKRYLRRDSNGRFAAL